MRNSRQSNHDGRGENESEVEMENCANSFANSNGKKDSSFYIKGTFLCSAERVTKAASLEFSTALVSQVAMKEQRKKSSNARNKKAIYSVNYSRRRWVIELSQFSS